MTTSSFLNLPSGSDVNVGSDVTQIPKWYQQYQQSLIQKGNQIANEPYQPYTGARIADLAPETLDAHGLIKGNIGVGSGMAGTGAGMVHEAGQYSSVNAASPLISQATGISAAGASKPYLDAATSEKVNDLVGEDLQGISGSKWTDNVDTYLNPFIDSAVNRMADLGVRSLHEKILPGVNTTFTGAGQFGSTRHGDFTNRAIRDTIDSISGTAAGMLSDEYAKSAGLYGVDMARTLDAIKSRGGFLEGDLNRQLSAGQTAASAASSDASIAAQMAALKGNLFNADAGRRLAAGQALGQMGGQIQNMNMLDASALEAIGSTLQGQDQKSLDLAYEDFQRQQDHPLRQLAIMQGVMQGQPIPGSGTTSVSATTPPSTNPLASLVGAAAGMYGLNRQAA